MSPSIGTLKPPSPEAAPGPVIRPLLSAGQSSSAPLSFAQERLWFLDQLEPESPLYNMPGVARLTGALDCAALEQSLGAMMARHETLRTRFICSEGEPFQLIDEEIKFSLPLKDLKNKGESPGELERLIRAEANRPFNLNTDHLLRVTLVRLGAEEHVLLVNMHHMISDERSFRNLFRELAAFYRGFVEEKPASLPELPVQYRDYACWQKERLQGEALEKQLRFWKEQLSGNPSAAELLTDRPRSSRSSCQGASQSRRLKPEITERLKRLAERERTTLFIVMLAGFKALLHRYTEQEDIVISSPVAGRNSPESEDLIGLFVNTLPLRTKVPDGLSFLELLARVGEAVLDAQSHQDIPFEKLVAVLDRERSLNLMAFTRIMFRVQDGANDPPALPGLKFEFLDAGPALCKFDLLLAVSETPQGLVMVAQYNAELFDASTMARLLEHYEILLEGIVAQPTHCLWELPLLKETERRQLLAEWNGSRAEFPRNRCVHELFEEQVRQRPDACAVIFGRSRLSYDELNARANQLAHHLKKAGVKPGMRVGICAERSLEMVVGLLGILKTGAAYAPLDPGSPKERLRGMLEDLQVPVLLAQQRLLTILPETVPPISNSTAEGEAAVRCSRQFSHFVVCLDTDWKAISREPPQNLATQTPAENIAYISFTSGSTGRPKGVCVPHRGIVRLVKNSNFASFSTQEVFLQLGPISFDASLFEIWGALLNGGQLVLPPPQLPSLSDLAEIIRKHQVTTAWFTAGLFNQMVDEMPEGLNPLRQILTGGDVVSPPHIKKALDSLPHCRIINGYGPTENTTFTTTFEITPAFDGQSPVPIGRPIANTECYILDRHLRPVPIGVPGELFVGGDGLAAGYVNQPELTAERFIPNPFKLGTVLYKTGDWVRYLADGNIEFLERSDLQVKIRGFRVELGEIESKLLLHPGVRQCAVVARPDASGMKQLVAYIVPAMRPAPTAADCQQFLRELVPDYMVPALFATLEILPLSPNGKVDRRNLPAPQLAQEAVDEAGPKDEVERELQQVWEAILNARPIGVRDKFFALGGHSLLAVRLVARVEKVFGKKLQVAAVFENPTIEQMAHLLRDDPSPGRRSSIVEIQPRGFHPPLLLVHGAGGGMFWGYNNLAHHLGPDQPVYAFNSRGLEGLEELKTIEALAESYLADLHAFQPRGPYFLGGYCFGGIVAYEMAHRLRKQGEDVALVALINSFPSNSSYVNFRLSPSAALKFAWNFCMKAIYSMPGSAKQWTAFLRWKMRQLAHRWKHGVASLSPAAGPDQVNVDEYQDLSQYPADQRRLWQAHIHALTIYHPPVSQIKVTLFRSPFHLLYSSFDPEYGWGELARGGVSVNVVPGAHDKIMEEPRVKNLAAALKASLEGA
ncbi:MAG: non-ribosomal peptide synthetase [Pedosphaera sp.]|nr:non-ribosomal peptide synthetase [Pedosphaera sp.]